MSLPPDTEALLPRHAEDETLLAYLDGELDPAEASAIVAHLEECWRCRSRVNALESSIHAFLDAREHLLPTDLAEGPGTDASFRRRLAAHAAAALPRATFRAALREWFGAASPSARQVVPPRLRYVLTTLAFVAGAVAAFVTWWSVPVSAAHVLARAEVYELVDVRCADLVVRSVIDVERIELRTGATSHVGVVETHTDPASLALRLNVRTDAGSLEQAVVWGRDALERRQPMAGAFPAPLARYFDLRQWAPGVDVRGYLRLVAGRGDTRVLAKRSGTLFEISHPFGAGHASGIAEARLYVDAGSWLPVRVSLVADGPDGRYELRFTRTALEFLPRTTEFATLFAAARPGAAWSAAGAGRLEGVPPAEASIAVPRRPLPLAWDASLATDEEVAVADVLHRTGADLGEEVNVFPMSDGSLLVQGLVDTDDRRQAIEQALRQVPGELRIELRLPAEVRGGSELFAPPWRAPAAAHVPDRSPASAPVVMADAAGLRLPVQQQLEQHVQHQLTRGGADPDPPAVRRAAASFSSALVARSRQALFHAWALYRLDQQFQSDRSGGLSAPAVASVARIRQSHRDSLARLAQDMADAIAPLVSAAAPTARPVPPGPEARALLDLVSDADALVRGLFTVSTARVDVAASLARLSSVLTLIAQERVSLS